MIFFDRVKEAAITTGTGNFTLTGAVSGFRSFFALTGANTFKYLIVNLAVATEWEIGTGTCTNSTTLVRNSVDLSSNSNAAVNFSAGTKYIYLIDPVSELQNASNLLSGTVAVARLPITPFIGFYLN